MNRKGIVLILAAVLLLCSVPCISEAVGKIYWTDATLDKIQGANLDGTHVEDLVIGLSNSQGIALDVSAGKMYWTDIGTGKIQRANPLTGTTQRANLEGSSVEDLLVTYRPVDIALDVKAGKMYWIQDERYIYRANFDGSDAERILTTHYRTTTIALEVSAGKIYWIRSGSTSFIYRANLDGTQAETLLNPHLVNGLGFPNAMHYSFGIALDISAGKMYWTRIINDGVIYRANLDGTHVEELLTVDTATALGFRNAVYRPSDIALDVKAGEMYWIASGDTTIYRADLDGTNVEEIFTGSSNIYDIALDVSKTGLGTFTDLLVVPPEDRPYEDMTLQHGGEVRCVAYSPWGVVLASGGTDDTMRLWRTTNGQALETYDQHDGDINSIAFSPNDTWIASGSDDGILRIFKWDVDEDTWMEAQAPEIEGDPLNNNVLSVAFSHDNTMLACGTSGNDVLLWDYNATDDKWVYRTVLAGHTDNVNSVAFRPGSTLLASASDDDTVRLWDARAGELRFTVKGHTADVNSIAFSQDGTLAVSGSDDGTVIVWRAVGNTWRYDRTVSSYYGNVNSVALSPTGNAFAMGCDDGAVLLCDMDSGAIFPLEMHTAKVRSVAFSKDGKVLASGSSDGKVRQWAIPPVSDSYGLEIPDNMVWLPASNAVSTYFFFGARVSSLTGAPHGADIEYKECKIKLHIPDQALYFILPVTTQAAKKIKAGQDISTAVVNVLGVIPGAAGIAPSIAGATIAIIDAWNSTVKAFTDDLEIKLPNRFLDKPEDSMPFIVMTIPRMDSVSVTVRQVVKINGSEEQTVTANRVWDLSDDVLAAPIAQPSGLKDWAPFQLLPSNEQEVLLQLSKLMNGLTRSTLATLETWQVPEQTSLLPNYPNPFNPETWIPYQLAESTDVTVTIYDINGRVVRDLDLGHQRAGMYHTRIRAAYWDGRNTQGEPVASGVYFYRLKAGDFSATRKMLIRK